MMNFDGYGWMGGVGGLGIVGVLIMVALVALLIWGAAALFDGRSTTPERPLDILRRRYADGEINQG